MNQFFISINKRIKEFLRKGRHIHPYIILVIDLLIVIGAFSLSYLIVNGLVPGNFNFRQYYMYAFVMSVISFPVIYFGKLHTGLLRFSNSTDLFRVFAATFTFSLIFLAVLFLFGSGIIGNEYK
ncbi:MAG: hypothetical protein ABIP68_08745, partial [Ferruginibacter sp.]